MNTFSSIPVKGNSEYLKDYKLWHNIYIYCETLNFICVYYKMLFKHFGKNQYFSIKAVNFKFRLLKLYIFVSWKQVQIKCFLITFIFTLYIQNIYCFSNFLYHLVLACLKNLCYIIQCFQQRCNNGLYFIH